MRALMCIYASAAALAGLHYFSPLQIGFSPSTIQFNPSGGGVA